MRKLTQEEYVERCRLVHGDKYDYSLVNYTGSHCRVVIVCPIHGEFDMLAYNHLNNKQECRSCAFDCIHESNRTKVEEFLLRYPGLKDYVVGDLNFSTLVDKICLRCPLHGEFITTPKGVIRGKNFCPKCSVQERKYTTDEFINLATEVHDGKYNYDKVNYLNSHEKIVISCPKHGEFSVACYAHLQGHGCPFCSAFVSKQENELKEYICNLGFNPNQTYRKIPGVREVDLFIDTELIAFEYNGLYWHSEVFKSDDYHQKKLDKVSSFGIKLIQIFDDEWTKKKDICKSRIASILGVSQRKIYARKTKVADITSKESSNFLNLNHLQGSVGGSYRLGLFLDDELVAVMVFGSLRRCLGQKSKDGQYEMLRYCSKIHTSVVGGASRLLNAFVSKARPKRIISYADRRWSDGAMYKSIGFSFVRNTKPNYFYTDGSLKRFNRFSFRKSELVKRGYDETMSEREIVRNIGLYRIYDCGSMLFEMNF